MLMGMDSTCSVCTVYMLFHLHGLHEAHRAGNDSFAFAIDVCIQDASEQHSLLRGYSCLQNVQAVEQHHTRHVATSISLHYLSIF